jgi:hypothetical protein
MARLTRWLGLLLAPWLLASCLLTPAKFTSTLDIRADRSFTFTYVGEVLLPKTEKPTSGDEPSEGLEDEGETESTDEARYLQIVAEPKSGLKSKAPKADETFGDTSEDATQLEQLARALSSEYGYRSVRYIGNRKLAIDYRISGKLDHGFIFPFHPDAQVIIPFLAIELRGRDRLRIKAPGFANDDSASSAMGGMSGMGGMGSSNERASELDGTFTLTTNAEIVSQNQEEGAQSLPDGTKKLVWTVNPNTRDAPMAVVRVNALP